VTENPKGEAKGRKERAKAKGSTKGARSERRDAGCAGGVFV